MNDAKPGEPPRQLSQLLSRIPTKMTVWPSDTEVEFNEKRAYLLAIASRLAFTSDDVDAIRRYIDAILATKNDEYIISMWHSLVGYRMSTGIGPSGRNFFDALLKALPADHVSR